MSQTSIKHSLEKIEQMRLEYFCLSNEINFPGISLEKIKENREIIKQLNQRFYEKTGKFITD